MAQPRTASERKPTVLVVDKDEGLARWLEETLRQAGFDVSVATSGDEGVSALGDKPIDLLISDQSSVECDAVSQLIEQRKNSAKLRLLVTCEGGRLGQMARVLPIAEKLQPDATLPKPFRQSELLAVIRTILGYDGKLTGSM